MKKLSLSGILMLLSLHVSFAQSGTILPTQADFSNNTTTVGAYALRGVITSTAPGGSSVGVRGQNNGTAGSGIGVWGSHAGSGWGVYGTTVGGIALYGVSTSGIGVYGVSTSGFAGRFDLTDPSTANQAVRISHAGLGNGISVLLPNASNGARGIDVTHSGVGTGVFATSTGGMGVWGITSSISAAGIIGDNTFGEAVVGRNRGGNGVGAVVGRNDSTGYGVRGFNTKGGIGVLGQSGISGGTGVAGRFENVNAANTSTALQVQTNSIGGGISVMMTNGSNGSRGIDVTQNGVGPGVFATSSGGMGLWGITSSISAAGVIGDNTYGEAVVGRNRGGSGVGAVVGRNDSTGYGVRGFNTKGGIGVLGQAGISGGTGVGGRFENVNAANNSNALESATNGSGAGGFFRNTGSSGNGAGAVVQKSTPFSGVFTSDVNTDLEVRHPIEFTGGMTGLRLFNTGGNQNSWTLYATNTDGYLALYAKGAYKGYFSPATGAYTTVSDSRLKNNIQPYASTLENLMKIGVKSYTLINSEKTEVGLLAQEALQYFPEIVYSYTSDNGKQNYAMDYSRIGVLAVKAVQEQQVIIQKQQAQIDALKTEMAELRQMIENLKK
jgi:hypothetical protein